MGNLNQTQTTGYMIMSVGAVLCVTGVGAVVGVPLLLIGAFYLLIGGNKQ